MPNVTILDCNWWSFYTESYVNGSCQILTTCPSIDVRRTHVVSGERNCWEDLPEERLNKVLLVGGTIKSSGNAAEKESPVIDFGPGQETCENLPDYPFMTADALG